MNPLAIILGLAVALMFNGYVNLKLENKRLSATVEAMAECWPEEEGELVSIARTKDGIECAVTSRNNGKRAIKSRNTFRM